MLTISEGASHCTINPQLGGSITSWTVADQNMLRAARPDALAAGNPLGMSSFPLVPYSNRIRDGSFEWAGKRIAILPNFAPEPNAIHGTGWEDEWTAVHYAPNRVGLTLDHAGDARWPWPFRAEQMITVSAAGLRLDLTATNLADVDVPLGFGHHPYFDAEGASLRFAANWVWLSGDDNLPTAAVVPSGAFDFRDGASVTGRSIDHSFAGWSGNATIAWQGRPLALEISASLPAVVVYIPDNGDTFCFEPVPHVNNALNLDRQASLLPVIAPGQTFTATIHFLAVASSDVKTR